MSSTELNRKLVEHIGPLLALDAAAQRLYIDEICAEEPRLRDDLEALAQEAGGLSDDFLETPASLLMGGDPATLGLELTPTPVPHIKRLGPYNILEVLGQGGMGTVFLGAQERPIRRRVAIKVIDGLNNPNRLERFAIECQALARLSHPNIASLHEVGKTEDGRPYVVMELIEGTVITEWCDEHRMSLGDRIELFLGVCAGIRHAHERGVLHRDLKPTNVLVTEIDGRAVAKVIDFGIACSLDDHTPIAIRTPTPTLERQLVGSPAYMSPEVARGERDLDTRSDVYSLGLLLYELIVGVSPFEPGDSLATLLRRLATEDRPSPTARLAGLDPIMQRDFAALRGLTEADLARRIGGDLDAIVCKAISRDREQRYSSASNLAADLERYLGHEPVTARPSTPSYLIGKFARRHRTVVATAAMVAASLVAGIVATSAALLRARQAEARAMQNFAKAQDVVDDFLTDVSENELLQAPGAQPVRKSLLERALRYYEEFIAQHEKDASLRFDLARASVRVGRINDELGMQQNSLPAFERAIGLLEDLADQYPAQPEYRYHLADATHRAAWSYYHNGQAEKSFAVGLRTLTLQERLVEDYPEVFEYRELFARGLADHGEALEVTGQDRAAVEVAQRSLRLFQELDRAQATAGRYRTDLAEAYTRYGGFLYRVERFDEGLEAHRAALQIYRQQLPSDSANDAGLESLDPSHRTYQERYAKGLLSFGSTLLAKGQLPEAQDAFDEALSIWRRLHLAYPALESYPYHRSYTLRNLGKVAHAQADITAAESHYGEAIRLLRGLRERNPASLAYHLQLAHQLTDLGEIQHQARQHQVAITTSEEAADLLTRYVGRNAGVEDAKLRLGDALGTLAASLYASGQTVAAIRTQERRLAILEHTSGDARFDTVVQDQRSTAEAILARWKTQPDAPEVSRIKRLG